jgi:hypothetical protein
MLPSPPSPECTEQRVTMQSSAKLTRPLAWTRVEATNVFPKPPPFLGSDRPQTI